MKEEISAFQEDLERLADREYIDWERFRGKTFFITGATGLIGYTLTSALLYYGRTRDAHIKVIALVRDIERARTKFSGQPAKSHDLVFVHGTIDGMPKIDAPVDYIVHGASPTASRSFVQRPVETIRTIAEGTKNVLEMARQQNISGMVHLSSMEVFGDIDRKRKLREEDLGPIDLFSPRSSYPEAKRLAEALCYAYTTEYQVPVTVARLAQTFGPGVERGDERVFAYLARCAIGGEAIRLKTDGAKENMYLYTADAVGAILRLLEAGERGTAYNVGDPETYCSIKELSATAVSALGGKDVPVITNCGGGAFPSNSYLDLDVSKLLALGWTPTYGLPQMFQRMVRG